MAIVGFSSSWLSRCNGLIPFGGTRSKFPMMMMGLWMYCVCGRVLASISSGPSQLHSTSYIQLSFIRQCLEERKSRQYNLLIGVFFELLLDIELIKSLFLQNSDSGVEKFVVNCRSQNFTKRSRRLHIPVYQKNH